MVSCCRFCLKNSTTHYACYRKCRQWEFFKQYVVTALNPLMLDCNGGKLFPQFTQRFFTEVSKPTGNNTYFTQNEDVRQHASCHLTDHWFVSPSRWIPQFDLGSEVGTRKYLWNVKVIGVIVIITPFKCRSVYKNMAPVTYTRKI